MNRYNIALIPQTQSAAIIKLAQNFSDISESYLLGADSLPHVTLCQFMQNDSDVKLTWLNVLEVLKTHVIELEFPELNIFINPNLFWVSLKPNKIDILKKMHKQAASVIKKPLGRCFKFYDAHMSLTNTLDKNFQEHVKAVEKKYKPIKDNFILALGQSDEEGQLKKIIHSCSPD
ncbi:MAG: hypothetical protein P4M12_06540 [Gammaproteobacteria bacterium]|nr:hypothetical protein [Gammaproteobacteria bacterium]